MWRHQREKIFLSTCLNIGAQAEYHRYLAKATLSVKELLFAGENTGCYVSSHFEVEQLRRTEQYYSVA